MSEVAALTISMQMPQLRASLSAIAGTIKVTHSKMRSGAKKRKITNNKRILNFNSSEQSMTCLKTYQKG